MNLTSCEKCGVVMDINNMILFKKHKDSYDSYYKCPICKYRLLQDCRDDKTFKFNIDPEEKICPECKARKSHGHYAFCGKKNDKNK